MTADERWMGEALKEAEKAFRKGEVPIGAVIVRDGRILGRGFNKVESRSRATAHAEMVAIESASRALGDWRLDGGTVYVTVEPCYMCVGAFFLARLSRVVYGARQPRSGACGSAGDIHTAQLFNHRIEVTGGLRETESLALLRRFFEDLRAGDDRRRDARAG
jgi:tRNA(adenine34) deaminase